MAETTTEHIRNQYPELAVWKLDDGVARYFMLGDDEEEVKECFRDHLDDTGMGYEDIDIESLQICNPDDKITITFVDHEVKVKLQAKQWAAIYNAEPPPWNIIGCSEWE